MLFMSKSCRWQDGIQFCGCHTYRHRGPSNLNLSYGISVQSWPCSGWWGFTKTFHLYRVPHCLTQQHITQHFAIHLPSSCTYHALLIVEGIYHILYLDITSSHKTMPSVKLLYPCRLPPSVTTITYFSCNSCSNSSHLLTVCSGKCESSWKVNPLSLDV